MHVSTNRKLRPMCVFLSAKSASIQSVRQAENTDCTSQKRNSLIIQTPERLDTKYFHSFLCSYGNFRVSSILPPSLTLRVNEKQILLNIFAIYVYFRNIYQSAQILWHRQRAENIV